MSLFTTRRAFSFVTVPMAEDTATSPPAMPPAEDTSRIHLQTWPPPEPAAEAKPATEQAPDATATEPVKADEPPPKADADDLPKSEPPKGPKGKDSPEKRIARAMYHQREAERRAEALERELAELRAQAPKPAPEPAGVAGAEATAEKPAAFPSFEAWQEKPGNESRLFEEYLDERADFRAAQKGYVKQADVERIATERAQQLASEQAQAAETARLQAEAEERAVAFRASLEDAKAKYDDWDTVVENSDLPTNAVMDEYLRRSGDLAGEMLHYLGAHPQDCERIAALRVPAEVIKEMTLIEVAVKGAPHSGPSVPAKPVTKAPPPITPLGSGSAASPGDLRSLSLSDFMKVRDEQERTAVGRF